MSGTMKLPNYFLQSSTSAHDWSTEVALQAKGNTYTACLFTGPDPALRGRFDGTAECTQGGHSLCGKTPDAETAQSFNRVRKEHKSGQVVFTPAIRMSLGDSTRQASERESPSETDFNALLKWVDKSHGRNSASSPPSYLDQFHALALVTSEAVDQFIGRVLRLLKALVRSKGGQASAPDDRGTRVPCAQGPSREGLPFLQARGALGYR
jgi:hypothetical protein